MKEECKKIDTCDFISRNKFNKIINCLNIADNNNLHTVDKFVQAGPCWIN